MQPMIKLIENYSDKAIIVIGQTFEIKSELKELNGSFNPRLKFEGLTVAGWVFSKKRIEAIRELVLKHSNNPVPVPDLPIMVRDEKPKVEPIKQVKPVVKTKQTGFKMLVKCTGFVELEREFTSEKDMLKFLEGLKEQRVLAVHQALKVSAKAKHMFEWFKWDMNKEQKEAFDNSNTNEERLLITRPLFDKYGIPYLKIQFTNLK